MGRNENIQQLPHVGLAKVARAASVTSRLHSASLLTAVLSRLWALSSSGPFFMLFP